MNWLNWIKQKMSLRKRKDAGAPGSSTSKEKLLSALAMTQEVELSCDEVLELLDQYTELAVSGQDVAKVMPLVHHHMQMCADCHEEFEALLRILTAINNGSVPLSA
jgi:hypothetical protein